MTKKSNLYKKGFTLIELIVVIAILGIVISAALSFFVFSNKTYNKGVDQSNIQSDIRLASSMIVDEIRFATEVKILSAVDTDWYDDPVNSVGTYDNYIFYYDEKVVLQSRYSRKEYTVGPSCVLDFDGSKTNVLNISIQGVEDEQTFDIETEVEPLNLGLMTGTIDISAGSSGSVIMYRSPNDYRALKALPEATLGPNTNSAEITVSFNKPLGNVSVVNELSNPVGPAGYTISKPDTTHVKVAVSGGAAIGTSITILVQIHDPVDNIDIDFYYTLTFNGTEWSIQ